MAESASKSVKLQFPVTINGTDYPAGIALDLPVETAKEAERLSQAKFESEMKRMNGQAPVNTFIQHLG